MSTGTGEKIRQTAYKRVSDEDQRIVNSWKINSFDLCRHTIPKNYVREVYIKRQLSFWEGCLKKNDLIKGLTVEIGFAVLVKNRQYMLKTLYHKNFPPLFNKRFFV